VNEQKIRDRWNSDRPFYRAWAELIDKKIKQRLAEAIAPTPLDCFLKVPAVPRLKGEASLVDKALFRGKAYENPYKDITDKAGIRYVVLLTTDIKKFISIIENSEHENIWDFSKDKDYEEERLAKPLEFAYQSVHYVLRSKAGLSIDRVSIPEGIACEVQIRTLLQHAHSELTHDTIYKPKIIAKPSIKRTVAKSMALIEATDEFFEQTMKELEKVNNPQRQLLDYLNGAYQKGTELEPNQERSNQVVIDALMEILPENTSADIEKFLNEKGYIFEKIKERNGKRHFFNQSTVLLAYFMAHNKPSQIKQYWPIVSDDLEQIFSDLGIAFE